MFSTLHQYTHVAFVFLRLVVALIFIVHALPKLRHPKAMAGGMGTSAGLVVLLGLVEFFSALALIFGLHLQLAGLLLALVMLGAMYMKALKWHVAFTARDKTGWEFDLVLFAAAILIFIAGSAL